MKRLTDRPTHTLNGVSWEEDSLLQGLDEDRAAFNELVLKLRPVVREVGAGGVCPKCGAPLNSDIGMRLENRRMVPIPLEQRSRVGGEPRAEHTPEVPPLLLPSAEEAPPEELREWHRITRDNWLMKNGDWRCADRSACETRYLKSLTEDSE